MGDVKALAKAVAAYLDEPAPRTGHAAAAIRRIKASWSYGAYFRDVLAIVSSCSSAGLKDRQIAPAAPVDRLVVMPSTSAALAACQRIGTTVTCLPSTPFIALRRK